MDMELCDTQKAIGVSLIFVAIIIVLVYIRVVDIVQAILIGVLGDLFVALIAYLLLRRPLMDAKKLAEAYHKLRGQREQLKELNKIVFQRWKKTRVYLRAFHVVVEMDEIDSDMLNRAKDFLKKEHEEILETWEQLETSINQYNEIGAKIKTK